MKAQPKKAPAQKSTATPLPPAFQRSLFVHMLRIRCLDERMLKDIGVTDIRIGDRSFWGDSDTAGNLERNGITDAAKKLGTKAQVFDDSVEWLTLPAASVPNWTGTVRLPVAVTGADHILVLSCVKTHFIAQITMSLKICLGLGSQSI